ncbi:hypothetical protein PFISCL1PPCAC_11807, partial [Pristionchus fissidentatus]
AAARPVPANYKMKLCTFFANGNCSRGEECCYAHGDNELRSFLDTMLANVLKHDVPDGQIASQETIVSFQVLTAATKEFEIVENKTLKSLVAPNKWEKCLTDNCPGQVTKVEVSQNDAVVSQTCSLCGTIPHSTIPPEHMRTLTPIPEKWENCRVCEIPVKALKESFGGRVYQQECVNCGPVVTTIPRFFLSLNILFNGRDALPPSELAKSFKFTPEWVISKIHPLYQSSLVLCKKLNIPTNQNGVVKFLPEGFFLYTGISWSLAFGDCKFAVQQVKSTIFISHELKKKDPSQKNTTSFNRTEEYGINAEQEWRKNRRTEKGEIQGGDCTIPVKQYELVKSTLSTTPSSSEFVIYSVVEIDDYEVKKENQHSGKQSMEFKVRSSEMYARAGIKMQLGDIALFESAVWKENVISDVKKESRSDVYDKLAKYNNKALGLLAHRLGLIKAEVKETDKVYHFTFTGTDCDYITETEATQEGFIKEFQYLLE